MRATLDPIPPDETMNEPFKPVIVALDFPTLDAALALADRLDPAACRVKVGKELFTRSGPDSVRRLNARGFEVFLDLKFHDIPNTVNSACRAATELGCWMLNVHAGGGRAMMEAAVAGVDAAAGNGARPLLIAVTVLTSLDGTALAELGCPDSPAAQVLRLARLAQVSQLDGVVCSALELSDLRAASGAEFALVTPGIRPAGSSADDQARVASPAAALATGASYLVIGRPITQAEDPAAAVAAIQRECTGARAR